MENSTHRAKTYVLMAETVLGELRGELDRVESQQPENAHRFIEAAGAVRKLLTYALQAYEAGTFQADIVHFVAPARRMLAQIDAVIGEEMEPGGAHRG